MQTENPFAAIGATGGAFSGGFSFGAAATTTPAFGMPTLKAEDAGEGAGEDDGEAAGEEECQAEFKPLVQLEEVETATGEEDEDVLLDM